MIGATNAPTPLKDCAKFKRCSDVSFGPKTEMYGLATVSRKVAPAARINSAARNKAKLCADAEGMNNNAPAAYRQSPIIIPLLYPYLCITNPAGIATRK